MSSMLDILKNFDEAEKGNKPAAAAQVGSMKAILESINKVEECGDMPMEMPQQGQPVTVSVTASGKDNVADLISLMQQAAGIEQHVDMPMAHDSHIDVDSHNTGDADMAKLKAIMSPDDIETEEWDNGPDEEYKDTEYMTKDIAGGINRQKKSHKPTNGGDNPMALENSIKRQLWAALNEKKKQK